VKNFRLVLIVILTAIILTACGPAAEPAADEPIEIVIWNTWSDHHVEAFQKLIDDFNEKHPNITVVQQPQPLADYEAKVMQAVREGEGPDIISSWPTVAANYIKDGLIVNLSEYIDDPEIGIPGFKEMVPPGIYKTITQWDGNVYLFPFTSGGEVFYYNKTLYDDLGLSVPTTWEELEEVSRIITSETGKPAFGFDNEIDGFQVLIMQHGSGYINPETYTVEYNNPIAVDQLEWFSGLVKEGVFRLVGEDVYFSNPFGSQAVASYIGSAAGYGFVESAVDGQFEFGVAPIPQSGEVEYISDWGGGDIIFTSTEAKQKAAFEFLKYNADPAVLADWGISFNAVPAYQEAIQQPAYQDFLESNPAAKAQSEQIHRVGHLSSIEGSAAIRTIIGRAVGAACTGLLSPAEALNIAETEGNTELSVNK
jgi:ABC-type glycerol-3-phosphate transport system substrate-binding protein